MSSEPSSDVVLILTEAALSADDVEHVLDVYRDPDGDGVPDPVRFRLLVPTQTDRHLLAAIMDHLGSGELRQAWADLTGHRPTAAEAQARAAETLATSIAALRDAAMPVEGGITQDDPLAALRSAVEVEDVREVVVITYPHALPDTFHTDWASRARDVLSVPVLHLYAGTSEVG